MMFINWPCINDPRVTFLLISISRIDSWQNISTNSRWYSFCILCRLERISGWHSATWSKPFTPCCRWILFLQPKSKGEFFSSSFRWLDSAICNHEEYKQKMKEYRSIYKHLRLCTNNDLITNYHALLSYTGVIVMHGFDK